MDFSNTTGAEIICQSRGTPLPQITWVKTDGSVVQDVPGLRQVSDFFFFLNWEFFWSHNLTLWSISSTKLQRLSTNLSRYTSNNLGIKIDGEPTLGFWNTFPFQMQFFDFYLICVTSNRTLNYFENISKNSSLQLWRVLWCLNFNCFPRSPFSSFYDIFPLCTTQMTVNYSALTTDSAFLQLIQTTKPRLGFFSQVDQPCRTNINLWFISQ